MAAVFFFVVFLLPLFFLFFLQKVCVLDAEEKIVNFSREFEYLNETIACLVFPFHFGVLF